MSLVRCLALTTFTLGLFLDCGGNNNPGPPGPTTYTFNASASVGDLLKFSATIPGSLPGNGSLTWNDLTTSASESNLTIPIDANGNPNLTSSKYMTSLDVADGGGFLAASAINLGPNKTLALIFGLPPTPIAPPGPQSLALNYVRLSPSGCSTGILQVDASGNLNLTDASLPGVAAGQASAQYLTNPSFPASGIASVLGNNTLLSLTDTGGNSYTAFRDALNEVVTDGTVSTGVFPGTGIFLPQAQSPDFQPGQAGSRQILYESITGATLAGSPLVLTGGTVTTDTGTLNIDNQGIATFTDSSGNARFQGPLLALSGIIKTRANGAFGSHVEPDTNTQRNLAVVFGNSYAVFAEMDTLAKPDGSKTYNSFYGLIGPAPLTGSTSSGQDH